ncbi:MAG: outer membrane protein OprN precursor, partial [Rhizobacter sp.]|nr:outer membrane protein OprN precursor [Rhizobacter sp.]
NLFPRKSLEGLIGFATTRYSGLLRSVSQENQLGLGLNWPLLDIGRVRSRIAASEARAQQSLASYEQTVAPAREETDGAMSQFTRTAQQAEHLDLAAQSADEAAKLANIRFDAGVVDFLVVLDAQRQALSARDALVQSQVGQATSLVAVYRALGGGWNTASASVTSAAPR